MESIGESIFGNVLPKMSDYAETSDYDKDGLKYCGKCNTPKSLVVKLLGKDTLVPTPCKCRQEKIEAEKERELRDEKREAIRKLKSLWLQDEKFKNAKFCNTQETKYNKRQLKIANRYVEAFDKMYEKNQGLLFYGGTGTGKSRLAYCICNELLEKYHTVVATSIADILQNAKYGKINEEMLDAIISAELVFFDDLGTERATDTAREIAYYVIDCRSRSNKPVIITTNLSLEEMKRVDDIKTKRVYERLLEICHPVEFTGPSYRMKIALERNDEIVKMLEGD